MNTQSTQQYLLKRRELIKKLRRNALLYQLFALLFLGAGLGLDIWFNIEKIENLILTVVIVALLFIGVILQIVALVYFNKAKKHLSGQITKASTNPKYWN